MNEYIAANINHAPPHEFYAQGFVPHSEIPSRVLEIERALKESSTGTLIYPENFLSVTGKLLSFIHDPKYVAYILDSEEREKETEGYRYATTFPYRRGLRTPTHPVGTLGYFSFDTYTPVHAGLAAAALSSANASYNAALDLLRGERASYAIARPPGHHAGYDYMGGYCYFNNVMVATEILQTAGKVAILDVDFHHGNGTHDIVARKNRQNGHPILAVSIHADPDNMFPYFSGKLARPPRSGCVNFPLELGVTNDQYDLVLQRSLEMIDKFDPKFLAVSIGFDTYKDDPIGGFQLTTAYYERMARQIMELGKPTVFIQEGGYDTASIGQNALSLIQGIGK